MKIKGKFKKKNSQGHTGIEALFILTMFPQVSGTGGRGSGETHIRDAWRPPPNLGIFGGDVGTSLKL